MVCGDTDLREEKGELRYEKSEFIISNNLMKHNFKNLDIWKRSKSLAIQIYQETATFPDHEKYGLTSQIRRCAVSVPSNIAEGCGHASSKELSHFLDISIGSLCELESLLLIAKELNDIEMASSDQLIDEVITLRKMTIGFKNTIK